MTVEWWNDLWLNEGFASYIEYKGVAEFETGWEIVSTRSFIKPNYVENVLAESNNEKTPLA